MTDVPETLTWECIYCGLETPEPELHLQRAHGQTIEAVMAGLEELEQARREFARLLMMSSDVKLCPLCGQTLEMES